MNRKFFLLLTAVNCRYKLATNHETHTVDVTRRLEKKP
jgi:hypothetical protein